MFQKQRCKAEGWLRDISFSSWVKGSELSAFHQFTPMSVVLLEMFSLFRNKLGHSCQLSKKVLSPLSLTGCSY